MIIYFDLKKELLLAQMYLSSELNEEAIYSISSEQFFNTPPQLSEYFTKPNLLPAETYKWREVAPLVEFMRNKITGDNAILYQTHNLLELGQLNAATAYVSENMDKVLNPQLKAQLNLLLLNAQGRTKEVVALGQSKNLDPNSVINAFILAQNHLRTDPRSKIYEYLKLLDTKGYNFYKEWLELEQIKAKGSLSELKAYLQNHYLVTDNFAPAFEARNLINSQ
jgi:hypothetical protein